MRRVRLFPLLMLSFFCASCAKTPFEKKGTINVGVEEGEGYRVQNSFVEIVPGQNAVFHIDLDEEYALTGCSYARTRIEPTLEGCKLTLLSVRYPVVVSLRLSPSSVYIHGDVSSSSEQTPSSEPSSESSESVPSSSQSESVDDSSPSITPYDKTNTSMKVAKSGPHIRANAPNGLNYFNYDGYLQVGWNTKADFTGEFIGFGWRYDKSITTLYGEFVKVSDASSFDFEESGRNCRIVGYHGQETSLVIPRYHNRKQVTAIAPGAIASEKIESLVLPPSLREIGEEGIACPNLKTLTFYDRLRHISGSSFVCPKLRTVRLNAIQEPCYSGSFWDTFQDKIDYLDKIKDKKKIVLFSGSSTRYGYFSPLIHEAYPDYEVVNMGVFAYFGIFQQLEIIGSYLKEGDIVVHAPEFDAIREQFCLERKFDHRFFFCLEAGFGEIARMDLTRIGSFFDAFSTFQELRSHCIPISYDEYAYHYDDEDHYYEELIYNENGDMTLPRPNTDFQGQISQPLLDYSLEALFGGADAAVETLDAFYQEFQERYKAKVYFTYAPKNVACLTPNSDFSVRFELDNYLRDHLHVPFLGGIEDLLMDTRYFYQIDNHLSTEGAQYRTELLIQWLASVI